MVPGVSYMLSMSPNALCTNKVGFKPPSCYHVEIRWEDGNATNSFYKTQHTDPMPRHDAGGLFQIVLRRNGDSGEVQIGCVALRINVRHAVSGRDGGNLVYIRESLADSDYGIPAVSFSLRAHPGSRWSYFLARRLSIRRDIQTEMWDSE